MECIGSLFAFVIFFGFGLVMASRVEQRRKREWEDLIERMEGCNGKAQEDYRESEDAEYALGTGCAGEDEEDDPVQG